MCSARLSPSDPMLTPGQTLSLTIDKPAAGGRMIARVDGQVVLVSGAIPGERVRARVERVGKGVVFAETVAIEEPSPDRRSGGADPLCGGNLFGFIAYPRQLQLKAEIVADAFARIGRVTLPSLVRVAPSPEEGYRMRARLHARGHRLGFFREGTHDICDVRSTGQLLPETCDALERLSAAIGSLGLEGTREIELSENIGATERVMHLDSAQPLDPRVSEKVLSIEGFTRGPYVTDVLSVGETRLSWRRHVLAFFQGNRYLLRDLVAHVTDRIPVGTTLLDLYAGAGLFSVAAGVLKGAWVVAVEGDPHAAEDLHANGAASGAQITTVKGAVEGLATGYARAIERQYGRRLLETIVVDPPRTGMTKEALDVTLGLKAARLIYVSCDVATLARDTRRIVDAGYTIERIDGFDMFPNTPHVETVVVFERSG
jgi:23S rRNA (uracil1939-C5)-methyltransferase